ncbi:CRISPR system Cascade subunit CasD [Actinokineospora baliensis]|uniref:type I-E CRISPR-associated protein Cas5/CasD n=1 Tax=Actinokineospora baliensis TaxID=547056 RepID=UPI0019564C96|nr:type I-E CRISPR-associated protein Cas5/CasD [Actinokineospora baliensis]MBM7774096.1 CRISPR system Cascade subunit CasD [Actinokineospora baliensis]
MSVLLLRFGGPLQSWGTHSPWNERDTNTYPTRSGIIGIIAAAQHRSRGEDLTRYRPLHLDVRVDRPGQQLVDFHTVGGGRPANQTVPISSGGYRPQGKGTVVSNRHYLADAVFTVALGSRDPALLDEIEVALRRPHWAGYLGRRSCPPDGPMLLARVDNGTEWLETLLPLARAKPREGNEVDVDFISETAPFGHNNHSEEVPDDPQTFHAIDRAYRTRTVHRYRRALPATLCAGYGGAYLDALTTALRSPDDQLHP